MHSIKKPKLTHYIVWPMVSCVQQYSNHLFSPPLLWPPCVTDADIIFLSWFLLISSIFFPQLFSAIADWMSTILLHMV